jgi:hypothetical protein
MAYSLERDAMPKQDFVMIAIAAFISAFFALMLNHALANSPTQKAPPAISQNSDCPGGFTFDEDSGNCIQGMPPEIPPSDNSVNA